MKFEIFGPFEIPRDEKNGLIDDKAIKKFWKEVGDCSKACGCYLFAVKAAKGIKPWYVGVANKLTFSGEALKKEKLKMYDNVISKQRGKPLLFLIARKTNTGKFAKPPKNKVNEIEYLETILIGVALDKNKDLLNIQKTVRLKNLIVPGLINTPAGKRSEPVNEFVKAIK